MTKTRLIGTKLVTITGLTEDVDTLMNAIHADYFATDRVDLIGVATRFNMLNVIDASSKAVA